MDKNKKRLLMALAGIFLVFIFLMKGPWFYMAEPIEAWVIDAKTKKPIEGVIIVANWELHKSTVGGRIPGGQLNVMETVTDKAGRFFFPGWGPKWTWRGYLDDRDPALLLFKSGYEYQGLQNPTKSYTNESSVRQSMWHGKTIELKKFEGGVREYYKTNLMFLGTSAGSIIRDNCGWKRIPKMVAALYEQKKLLTQKSILNSLYSIDQLSSEYCGSAQKFLRKYMK